VRVSGVGVRLDTHGLDLEVFWPSLCLDVHGLHLGLDTLGLVNVIAN